VQIILASETGNQSFTDFATEVGSQGIQVIFTTINAIPYFMNRVNKIIVGSITMYSNGSMLGIAGTALV